MHPYIAVTAINTFKFLMNSNQAGSFYLFNRFKQLTLWVHIWTAFDKMSTTESIHLSTGSFNSKISFLTTNSNALCGMKDLHWTPWRFWMATLILTRNSSLLLEILEIFLGKLQWKKNRCTMLQYRKYQWNCHTAIFCTKQEIKEKGCSTFGNHKNIRLVRISSVMLCWARLSEPMPLPLTITKYTKLWKNKQKFAYRSKKIS